MISKYKTKCLKHKSNQIVLPLYQHFDLGGSNYVGDEFHVMCNQFVNGIPLVTPKDMYNSLTKFQLIKRIGDDNPESLQTIPQKELDRIRDVQTKDVNGFLMACEYGSIFCVKMMVDYKCPQIKYQNANKSSGLHIACERNHIEIVKYIISKNPKKLLKLKDGKGRTALHCALLAGHTNLVILLMGIIQKLILAKYSYLMAHIQIDNEENEQDEQDEEDVPGVLVPSYAL